MKTKDLFILALIAAAIWYYSGGPGSQPPRILTTGQKRSALAKWIKLSPTDSQETKDRVTDLVLNKMTDDEVANTYAFITLYVAKGQPVPDGSELQKAIAEISTKYNIFT